jgi:ABC-type glucose/galactose transport system permease subunit
VFARLPDGALIALAILALGFAVSAVTVDERVRDWFERHGGFSARLAMLGIAGLMVAAGTGLASGHPASLGAAPWAPILLLGMPVTVALLVAAFRAALRERAGAGKAPAATLLSLSRR